MKCQPNCGNWREIEGVAGDVYDTGHEHSHTFEVEGRYEFVCVPCETAGMVGTIVVEEG